MKRSWALLPCLLGGLLVCLPCVCLAQATQDAQYAAQQRPDPTQLAIAQARRDGRMLDADRLLREQIQQLEASNPNSGQLAAALKQLSMVAGALGHLAEAQTLLQRVYEMDRAVYGPSSLNVAADLAAQASAANVDDRPLDAERLLKQAMDIVYANQNKITSNMDNGLAATAIGKASIFYLKQRRWQEADPLLQEEKRYCDAIPEPYRGGFGECGSLSSQLSQLYAGEGRSVEAQQVPKESLLPPELADLERSAGQYTKDGLYPSAEDAYTRAIAIAQKIEVAPDPPNRYPGIAAREMNALGQLFEKEGLLEKAESEYTGALELNEKRAGPQPSQIAYAMSLNPQYLVALYRTENRLKDAEAPLQTVLNVQVKALGDRHRSVAQTMTTLAGVYKEEGKSDNSKYSEALALYMRVLEISELNLGADNPALVPALANYADILRRVHQDAQAAQVLARMNALYRAQNPAK